MKKGLIYIHGKGGKAQEAEHYSPLFPHHEVIGFDYKAEYPWQARTEFTEFFDQFSRDHSEVSVVCNSIGAYFAIMSLYDRKIKRAYFISPIVNMEGLIEDMMMWAGVTQQQLQQEKIIETSFGEQLSWDYLSWVRNHPVSWEIPTCILYGSNDNLQSSEAVMKFAKNNGCDVRIMENGEHWFHTPRQMAFLDKWITEMQKENDDEPAV